MKIPASLILLVLLQLVSCQQKYGFRKTVRVPSKINQEAFAKREIIKPNDEPEMGYPEMASIDSGASGIIVPSTHIIIGRKLHIKEKNQVADAKKGVIIKTEPQKKSLSIHGERRWNKKAIGGFVFALLGISLVTLVLLGTVPPLFIILGITLAVIAMVWGASSLKAITQNNDKGKGFAWFAKFIGVLVFSILLGFLISFPIIALVAWSGGSWLSIGIIWGIASLIALYFIMKSEKKTKLNPFVQEKQPEEKSIEEKPKNKMSALKFLTILLLCLGTFYLMMFNVFLGLIPVIAYIIWYKLKHPRTQS